MKSILAKVRLLGVVLNRTNAVIEASLLYMWLDDRCYAVLVETSTDDFEDDYEFYITLQEAKSVGARTDLEEIWPEDFGTVDFELVTAQAEEGEKIARVRIAFPSAEVILIPSTRFYFSVRIDSAPAFD